MKRMLTELPFALQKELLLRMGGASILLFFIIILFAVGANGEMVASVLLPFALLLGNSLHLAWIILQGKCIAIEGRCVASESSWFRRQISRSVDIETSAGIVRVRIRGTRTRIMAGMKVRLYIQNYAKTRLHDGKIHLDKYLAIEKTGEI